MSDQGIVLNVPTPLLRKRVEGNPFGTLKLMWCRFCKMEVDANNEVGQRDGCFVFKACCQRCGRVIAYGAYDAALVGDPSRMMQMKRWCVEPQRDRR